VAYLFDTDAISESLRRKPSAGYLEWLRSIPREEQFVSAVTIGELYQGAYRSAASERHLQNVETRVLTEVIVLPFDVAVAKTFGRIRVELERAGTPLPDADLQIAATAITHDLELVTGNLRHFTRIGGLRINTVLRNARR
jgi:tRNA(fMet)-specific endonuclease VapC